MVNLEDLLTPRMGSKGRPARGATLAPALRRSYKCRCGDGGLAEAAELPVESRLCLALRAGLGSCLAMADCRRLVSLYPPNVKVSDPMGSITVTTLTAPNPPPLVLARLQFKRQRRLAKRGHADDQGLDRTSNLSHGVRRLFSLYATAQTRSGPYRVTCSDQGPERPTGWRAYGTNDHRRCWRLALHP